MESITEFVDQFREIQDQLSAQYPGVPRMEDEEEGGTQPICHILHRELGLGQTPREDAEEQVEKLRAMGIETTADDIDLTVEHRELHQMLRQVRAEGRMVGMSEEELLALMWVQGRRAGMREAADSMSFFDDDLGDITGP